MFWLKEIRDRLFRAGWQDRARQTIRVLIKRSESPAGLAMMAACAFVIFALFQVGGPAEEPAEDIGTPSAAAQSKEGSDQGAAEVAQAPHTDPVPQTADMAKAAANADATVPTKQYRLRRNETLIGLMKRAGVSSTEAHKAVNALKDVANLRKLQRGQEIHIARPNKSGQGIHTLRMRDGFDEEVHLVAEGDRYKASRAKIPTLPLTHYVEGEITDSLYLSAQRAGLPAPVIVELIRLMSFDVDFEREIRRGDRFQVYFERQYAPDFGDIAEGRILHVKLELQRRTLEATYYEDSEGRGDYFAPDGNSTRKALMKTPLDVTVVTSNYGKRKHPVLGYTRQHTGVDFRARTGTPIMAAGDGVVERASRYGSYGNYIRIRHNSTYKTAYAHLSRYGRGIKAGARVKQGQIIGYAGATGRVTAAHLHYEVLVNGKHANPLTLKLPTGRTLTGEELARFKGEHTQLLADISQVQAQHRYRQTVNFAQDTHTQPDRSAAAPMQGER